MINLYIGDKVWIKDHLSKYDGEIGVIRLIGDGLYPYVVYLEKFDGYYYNGNENNLKCIGELEELHPVPEHYDVKGLEQPTMDIIYSLVKHNGEDPIEGALLFSLYKYVFRYGKKDGVKDLRKALDFLTRLIDHIEA